MDELFNTVHDIALKVERGQKPSNDAAHEILLKNADFLPPPMKLADENMRAVSADAIKELIRWDKLEAPSRVKNTFTSVL